MKRIVILLGGAVLLLTPFASADVPGLVNLQGRLKDGAGNLVANGSYSVIFTIYDAASNGNVMWAESTSVNTSNGIFNVLLGSVNPVPDSVFNDPARFLGIKVGTDPETTPRQRLTSVGYSQRSSEWTSAAGELFRLNGDVGIGTSSPMSRLQVDDPNSAIVANVVNDNAGEVHAVQGLVSGSFGEKIALSRVVTGGVGEAYGVLARSTTSGVNYGVYGSAFGGTTNWAGYFPSGDVYVHDKVGLGTTSPAAKLHVKGAGFPGAFAFFDTDEAGQDAGLRFYENGVVKGHVFHQASTNTLNVPGEGYSGLSVTSIGRVGIGTAAPAALLHVNGTAGNNTGVWSTLSDRRLKREIQPLRNGLETVAQLKPVTFRWKDDEKDTQFGRVRGLIAQDVEEVIPEWVKTDPDGYKRIEPIGVDALMIAAIQELKATVASQAVQLAAQNAQIEKLSALVSQLAADDQARGKKFGQLR